MLRPRRQWQDETRSSTKADWKEHVAHARQPSRHRDSEHESRARAQRTRRTLADAKRGRVCGASGDNGEYDHADWANARLDCEP
jgi:hypothetical protein